MGKVHLAHRGEERVDVLLLEVAGRVVELGLNTGQLTCVPVAGDDVDARVYLPVAARPVAPEPHVRELVRVLRLQLQVPLHQPLELRALVPLIRGGVVQLVEHAREIGRPHEGYLAR